MIVLGASGQIGSRLLALGGSGSWGTSTRGGQGLEAFDLEQGVAQFPWWRVRANDMLVFAAAISSPDICENDTAKAMAINVDRTRQMVEAALAKGLRVLFLSSDAVYGEAPEAVDESSPCNPVSHYGEMKARVEGLFFGEPGFKAIRLSYVFYQADKFTSYISKCHAEAKQAVIYSPLDRAVVWREDVVDVVRSLDADWKQVDVGLVNVGGPELVSRAEFAERLKQIVFTAVPLRLEAPEPDFFKSRPRVVNMKSPWMDILLGRKSAYLNEAIQKEFKDLS